MPAPVIGTKLRGDVGLLEGDRNGVKTVGQVYWSGKSQNIVSGVPSEARIAPALWGDLYFTEAERTMIFGPGDADIPLGP